MTTKKTGPSRPALLDDFGALTRDVVTAASRGLGHLDFLRALTARLAGFSSCSSLELRLEDGATWCWWVSGAGLPVEGLYEERPSPGGGGTAPRLARDHSPFELLCSSLALGVVDRSTRGLTANGGLTVPDVRRPVAVVRRLGPELQTVEVAVGGRGSLAMLPFAMDGENAGLLLLRHDEPRFFKPGAVEFYQGVAQTLGVAVSDHRARYALRERVKELTCLYGIARVLEHREEPLEQVLQGVVELLPPAWQHPEAASACLELDGACYATANHGPEFDHCQGAAVVVRGERRGQIKVCYRGLGPESRADPYLREEGNLIAAVAREVALVVERRQVEADRSKLQDQIRHADRLANIGLLAAGVAHELNEPLCSILGFAQLAGAAEPLPPQAAEDLGRIVAASLYAREVVKKLMLFARQMPPRRVAVDLNQVITDALYLFESRCARASVSLERRLAADLPTIEGDPSQLTQVFVNLVVNAIQAMPRGGRLMVGTEAASGEALLVVEDTGVGMPPEVQRQMYLPFFTTKDVHEGTGLGLAVVHGIVTAHGGTVRADSVVGRGTRFEVRLPAQAAA